MPQHLRKLSIDKGKENEVTLIYTFRTPGAAGRTRFVPGSLACSVARRLFTPTPLHVSPLVKMRPGLFSDRTIRLLAPQGA